MKSNGKFINIPAENLEVIDDADVVVVGGGTSGFIAAVAAARAGARTILIERFGYLGGCTTTPYNTSINRFGDSDGNRIIGGIPWEFMLRMEHDNACIIKDDYRNQVWPQWTKKVALDMINEAGVNLYFYTWVSGVVKKGEAIQGIIVQTKAGRGIITARAFVDASGDADVAAFAGSPYEMTELENLQQVSCDYTACGVDAEKVVEWVRKNPDKVVKVAGMDSEQQKSGIQHMFTFVIPNSDTRAGYHVGVMPTVKLCIHREAVRLQGNVEIDPLDPKALTTAEVNGLYGAINHLNYLKEMVPGFKNAFIVAQNHLGVRETRRIHGEYTLRIDDLLSNTRFDDVVALNCRSLDFHLKGTVFQIDSLQGNHDIPLRSLIPKNVENLTVAGRCISCDHKAHASLRGAATCMATGQAAGVASALASKANGKIRDLRPADVQKALLEQNAILGTGERSGRFKL